MTDILTGETYLGGLWLVAVYEEADQEVFLVGLQHDVRHGGRGGSHTNLSHSQSHSK